MESILDVLIKKGVLVKRQVLEIKRRAKEEGKTIEDVLYTMGLTEDDVLAAKSEAFEIPIASLAEREITYEVLKDVPEESARYYKFVPIGKAEDGSLEVGEQALHVKAFYMDLSMGSLSVYTFGIRGTVDMYEWQGIDEEMIPIQTGT
ncbi:MAG: hypothetical protein HYW88_03555, partial [Candidatus Sungbacteria bacterium]|nr:hypothetical protein [Candidatus Sungbacteria bacterium]